MSLIASRWGSSSCCSCISSMPAAKPVLVAHEKGLVAKVGIMLAEVEHAGAATVTEARQLSWSQRNCFAFTPWHNMVDYIFRGLSSCNPSISWLETLCALLS